MTVVAIIPDAERSGAFCCVNVRQGLRQKGGLARRRIAGAELFCVEHCVPVPSSGRPLLRKPTVLWGRGLSGGGDRHTGPGGWRGRVRDCFFNAWQRGGKGRKGIAKLWTFVIKF